MKFVGQEPPLSKETIARIESFLGVHFPDVLRQNYLTANGGEPIPYVFESDVLDTVVSEFLPLASDIRGTAVQCYQKLVLEERIVEKHFFPFAVDGGGDYFFTDIQTEVGDVYFYNSDSSRPNPLIRLNLGIDSFWKALKAE
jgi:hypothetical protein